MALTLGAAQPTAQQLTMTEFAQLLRRYLTRRCAILDALMKEGYEDMDLSVSEHRFGFQTTQGATTRGYGGTSPRQFDNCDDAPTYVHSNIGYNRFYSPMRYEIDIRKIRTMGGDLVANQMKDTMDGHKFEFERQFLSCTGNQVLFQLNGAGAANPDGTWTFPVINYGGIAGQQLGHILQSLHLERVPLQAASAVGVAPVHLTPRRAVRVNRTLGAETITVDGDLADTAGGNPAAATWVVYRSRRDNGGITGADDGLRGLPLLADNGARGNPLQDIDVLTATAANFAPNWVAAILNNLGVAIPLTEAHMIEMITAAEILGYAEDIDQGYKLVKWFFTMHTANYNQFATNFLNLRQMTPGVLWKREGVITAGGFVRQALTVNGYPIFDSHVHQRNSVYGVDAMGTCMVHNGPWQGEWITRGGQREVAVPCSPDTELDWMSFVQTAVKERNRLVRRDDVASPASL